MPLMNLQSFLIYSLSKEFLRTDHEAGIRLVQGINSKQDQHSPHSQRTYGQKRVLGEKFKGESTFAGNGLWRMFTAGFILREIWWINFQEF